jgi:hypothetical protein
MRAAGKDVRDFIRVATFGTGVEVRAWMSTGTAG